MRDTVSKVLLVVVALLLAALLLQPYANALLFGSYEPRQVAPRADLAELESSTIAIFESIAPSVVQVVGVPTGRRSAGGAVATGTGFLWDAAGHIVTNNHVVEGAGAIAVRFPSGDLVWVVLVGRSPNHDLAVLRMDRRSILPPPVPVGSIEDLQVGQIAYAIGNPFGLDQSLTMGIISALKRRLPTGGGREITDVIQTDAAINPGNSGGPLLDSAGRLIGVNTAIFSLTGANVGVGFAIPVNAVNRVVPELIRTGRYPTPGIGIAAADEAVSAQLGVSGVVIAAVAPGSPAAQAGLRGIDPSTGQLGDVIVEVDGRPVQRLADLTDRLEEVGVGGEVTLGIRRGGSVQTVTAAVVDIGER
jgi:2-alkenal reductase